MKKISFFATLFFFFAPFGIPSPAFAADGCTTLGATCTVAGYNGSCAQDPDLGNLYCRPTVLNTSSGTQGGVNQRYITYYYQTIIVTVNQVLVPILIAIAFIVFLWGIFKYFIWHGESESEKAEGRLFAMWGVIGFVIILSIWGLVNMVKDTVIPSTVNTNRPDYPTL